MSLRFHRRKYVFRGYDSFSHSWIYGSLCEYANKSCIYSKEHSEVCVVDPYSIGLCSKLYDFSDEPKLIFEGDIVKYDSSRLGYVFFNECAGCFCVRHKSKRGVVQSHTIDIFRNCYPDVEVVGNMYENEDMLRSEFYE